MKTECKRIIAGICIIGLLLQIVPVGKVSANQWMQETTKESVEENQDAAETLASKAEVETAPDVSDKKEAELIENTDFSIDDVPDELLESVDLDSDEVTDIDEVDKLDLHSFTTVNEDSTKTLHVFETPIKYYDETENEVKFIDNSLERSDETDANGEEYAFENTENSTKVYLPENSSEYVSIANSDRERRFPFSIRTMGMSYIHWANSLSGIPMWVSRMMQSIYRLRINTGYRKWTTTATS